MNIIKDRRIADNNVRINDARNVLKIQDLSFSRSVIFGLVCPQTRWTQRSGVTQIDALNDLIDNWFHKFSSYSVLLYHTPVTNDDRAQAVRGHVRGTLNLTR